MWSSYKQLRNQVTKEIRLAVSNYYHGLIKENSRDPKKMWKTINKVLDKGANSTTLTSIEIERKTLMRERNILEALNEHFVTVGRKLAEKFDSRPNDDCLYHIENQTKEVKFKTLNEDCVRNAISRLKTGKSAGPDKIPATLIKDVRDLVCKPLAMILNSSLSNGVCPEIWKIASITPFFKSGSKKDVNNYRPISVISIFAWLLESIVHDQFF